MKKYFWLVLVALLCLSLIGFCEYKSVERTIKSTPPALTELADIPN